MFNRVQKLQSTIADATNNDIIHDFVLIIKQANVEQDKKNRMKLYCFLKFLLDELNERKVPLSDFIKYIEVETAITELLHWQQLLKFINKSVPLSEQNESIVTISTYQAFGCKIKIDHELPSWKEIKVPLEAEQKRDKSFTDHEEKLLKEEQAQNIEIEKSSLFNDFLTKANSQIVSYKESGRANFLGKFFGFEAKHKEFADKILQEFNNIITDYSFSLKVKIDKIENLLNNKQQELKDMNSKRLLPIISNLLNDIKKIKSLNSPPPTPKIQRRW